VNEVSESLSSSGGVVSLAGWIAHSRRMGGLHFLVLRDYTDKIQVVVEPETIHPDTMALIESLSRETVVTVKVESPSFCISICWRQIKREGLHAFVELNFWCQEILTSNYPALTMYCTTVQGRVRERPQSMINPKMKTGTLEVLLSDITVLNNGKWNQGDLYISIKLPSVIWRVMPLF
jgi:aspartyl-tRNA synthetase